MGILYNLNKVKGREKELNLIVGEIVREAMDQQLWIKGQNNAKRLLEEKMLIKKIDLSVAEINFCINSILFCK
jgi:hypothetical protein